MFSLSPTKRRRAMGTRRNGKANGKPNGNGSAINMGTAINVFSIPIITGIITVAGFYYVTKDELQRHEVAIAQTIPGALKDEATARETTRNEFLGKFDKLSEGVAGLNTKAALAEERDKIIGDTLVEIRNELQGTPAAKMPLPIPRR
jgi:hypothetical protein